MNRRDLFKSVLASAAFATGLARTTLAAVVSERTIKIPYISAFEFQARWWAASAKFIDLPGPVFSSIEVDALEFERMTNADVHALIKAHSEQQERACERYTG